MAIWEALKSLIATDRQIWLVQKMVWKLVRHSLKKVTFSLEWHSTAIVSQTKDQDDLVSPLCEAVPLALLLLHRCLVLLWVWAHRWCHKHHNKSVPVDLWCKKLNLLAMISDWTKLGLQFKVFKAVKTCTIWELAKFLSVDGEAVIKISLASDVETAKGKNQNWWALQDMSFNRSTFSKLLSRRLPSSRKMKSTCAASK